MQAPGRIQQQGVASLLVGRSLSLLTDSNRILVRAGRKNRDIQLIAQFLKLFNSRRPINIRRNQVGFTSLFS